MSENKNKPVIVGLGEVLWDLLPGGKELGGAPANFACHSQCLGSKSYVVSSVGEDDLGDEMLDYIDVLGLDRQHITIDSKHPTGTVTVKLDEDGIPDYIIHEDVAWDNILWNEDLKKLSAKTDAVCFGSLAQRSDISRTTIQKFLQLTRKNCLHVFDVNLRQSFYNKQIIEKSLKLTDIIKLNEKEFTEIAEMFSFTGTETGILSKLMNEFDIQLIALTKGAEGSILYTKTEDSFYKVPAVKVVDTVGAGDSFTGALIMGLLRKFPLKTVHKHAAEISAFVCTQKGATPELPGNLTERFKNK